MAFRKLHFKNVQGSRSGQTLQAGELAVDESSNQLFIGDQSTSGGVAVAAKNVPAIIATSNTTVAAGDTVVIQSGTPDITVPSSPSTGDLITVIAKAGGAIKDGATTIVSPAGGDVIYVYYTGSAWDYVTTS